MTGRRLWAKLSEMSEDELRVQVVIPLLEATPNVANVTDVHGPNEKGLDIVFTVSTGVEELVYGLQLKKGAISGGGTARGTVKEIVDQLQLADSLDHPVVTKAGTFRIDRFVVATSGTISGTAKEEITRRVQKIPVTFWDGSAIRSRVHTVLPQLFELSDGESIKYLRQLRVRYDALDALDQVPGVAKRTLSQVFIEPHVRRTYDPTVASAGSGAAPRQRLGALQLPRQGHNAVLVGDQDSGKTSVLRMIALTHTAALLDGGGDESHVHCGVPVLVRAKDVLGNALKVQEAIELELRRTNGAALIETLSDDLRSQNYFLLIDGFSEFTREEDKALLGRMLEEFAVEFPMVRIIVAARTTDFLRPSHLLSFYQYQMLDFDDGQVGKLIQKWTKGSTEFADVGQKMVERLREALQLPGSPIPATIGVMLHEEQNKFVTNTAEAIDRYMVIRLGRYANELGMRQEVEWTRKQDMLAEIAFEMVSNGTDALEEPEFIDKFNAIFRRQGDREQGDIVFRELVGSGVLVADGRLFTFHRSSFRDFFAGHHIFRQRDLDSFALESIGSREWGAPLVFASGLRRANSSLLSQLSVNVERRLGAALDDPDDDTLFSAFVLGRILSNSETSDHRDRVAALRTVLHASSRAIPGFEHIIVERYGAIGSLMALIGAEHSLFITLGVPWLRHQIQALIDDAETTEEERYLLSSMYAHLGFDDSYAVLGRAVSGASSLRVMVALDFLVKQLTAVREVTGAEERALADVSKSIRRKLAGRGGEIKKMLELKSRVLAVEQQRMNRIVGKRRGPRR